MISAMYMGIDYGTKRVGVAFSDTEGVLAFPHDTLKNTPALIDEVMRLALKRKVETVVVGNSLNGKRVPNAVMREIEGFVEMLTKDLSIPVVLEEEWFTTLEADRFVKAGVLRDAQAAALILQRYLDTHRGK